MIRQVLLDRLLQYASRLIFSSFGLMFFGYSIPMWFFNIVPNIVEEIIVAAKMDKEVVVAIVRVDFGEFVAALMRPLAVEPHSFGYGRWGFGMCIAGVALLLIVDCVSFGFSVQQALKARSVARRNRKAVEEQKPHGDARGASASETGQALDGKPRVMTRQKFED